jgi:hypothetical protein
MPSSVIHTPNDTYRQKHSKHIKMKSTTNNLLFTILYDCKTNSLESAEYGRAGLCADQPGGAIRAPYSNDHSNPLSELPPLNLRTCSDHMLLNTTFIRVSPHNSLSTGTRHITGTLNARKPNNGMQIRDEEKPHAQRHPPKDRRRMTPLLMQYTEKI